MHKKYKQQPAVPAKVKWHRMKLTKIEADGCG
jgi:hypothetical protein